MSKILSMKAVTDEKKRKKRQKQRTKRKLDKNKSANKFILSSSMSQKINLDKNILNTYYKEKTSVKKKDKEKISERDNINYLEHTVTTDFSMAETNPENKTDKIVKGTEKLNDIFVKSAVFYRILGIKNSVNSISINKENTDSNIDSKVSEKERKGIKMSNGENESDNDEDSGESSFGI